MKTIYINEKKKMTKWRIKRIAKKIHKIGLKEKVIVALSNELNNNTELINAIQNTGVTVLNRKMVI